MKIIIAYFFKKYTVDFIHLTTTTSTFKLHESNYEENYKLSLTVFMHACFEIMVWIARPDERLTQIISVLIAAIFSVSV